MTDRKLQMENSLQLRESQVQSNFMRYYITLADGSFGINLLGYTRHFWAKPLGFVPACDAS